MSEQTKSIKTHPTYNKVVKNYNKSFSMYAETDLDQPTDYSLRYAEDDSDSSEEDNNTDECNKTNKSTTTTTTTTNNEFIQDTIKTYCTEDTPYETPFNFSTATSMSDLRIDDKQIDKSDNNDDTTTQNDNNKDTEKKIVKSEYSSGLMSPEKPINYCEEGTPGYFSRVPSLSSLNSIPVNENETTPPPPPPQPSTTKIDQNIETKTVKETKRGSEVKAVKFEEVVNYAEETPLMFSRSSSLASLDSIEQHSIHDDRSSVISDFSRLTSGLVSPSELPDSPTQTIPSSPKTRISKQQKCATVNVTQTPPKANIFEDTVRKFKLESTPIQFSRATSLSSLTIDEQEQQPQPQQQEDEQLQETQEEASQQKQAHDDGEKVAETDAQHNENCDQSDEELEKLDLKDHNDNSGSSEEDDDILAACINIGIQNNRYSQQKSNRSSPDLPSTYNYPQNKLNNLNQHWLEEDKKNVASNDLNISLETNLGNSSISSSDTSSESGEAALLEECILAGMPKKTNVPLNTLSIKSNELTEAEQALLQQCILDGMKKSRLSPKKQLNSHKTNDLTESERSLLQQCIMAGMQKNNRSSNNNNNHHHHHRPSTSKDTTNPELTYAERQMLEQCILEGMPKANRSINNNRPTTTTTTPNTRRFRDYERLSQTTNEHTCCIHCPRNQQKQLMLRQNNNNNHLRMKKKNRNHERTTQLHINKENKDVNILYVTSQILALKKEMIDRSHEEWV